ncbi:MAG: hypothetical protein FJ246_02195 [Nitrospira sp.]|nr:hypothetical protein [Nitrospira sp.]
MNTVSFLRGVRFVDSFFPSGGYAFSSGLEAAVQGGAVRTGEALSLYAKDFFMQGLGRREAVAVARAWSAVARGKGQGAKEADWELEAMNLCRETRMASRQMGRQVIRIVAGQNPSSILQDYLAEVETGRTPGHVAVSLGLTLGACGWEKEEAVAAYLYQHAVGLVSASLKLFPIGQREAQRLLDEWTPMLSTLSGAAGEQMEMTAWTPVQDIHAMRHKRLTMRLFRS